TPTTPSTITTTSASATRSTPARRWRSGTTTSRSARSRSDVSRSAAGLHPQQAIQVRLLPGAGAVVVGEQPLFGKELRAVEAAPAVLALHLVLAVQHLVIDDPRDEVVRHAVLIERGMDADDPVLDREAAHLDRPAPPAARRDRPPGDARLQPTCKVRGVQPI